MILDTRSQVFRVRLDGRVVPSLHGTPQVLHFAPQLDLLSLELLNDLSGYEHGYRRLVAFAKVKASAERLRLVKPSAQRSFAQIDVGPFRIVNRA